MKQIKNYAEHIEQTALDQFNSAMEQDYVVKGALMPDAHTGYTLPIGAVVATDNVVVPSWVGYDIGCGVAALKIPYLEVEEIKQNAQEIFDAIYTVLPVGSNVNKKGMEYSLDGLTDIGKKIAESKKYTRALGSLGGGNHFLEIGTDEENNIWIVVHSGSRGVGHGLATHYMKLACSDPSIFEKEFDESHADLLKHAPEKYDRLKTNYVIKKTKNLKPKEGHYGFDADSEYGKQYIQDLSWALDYALENRKQMISKVAGVIDQIIYGSHEATDFTTLINRNHNHATEKEGLWIHRKGATHAEKGMMGVIPGNMRDGSFIVEGKGNPDSLFSSSHGAGRVLGRKQAKRELIFKDFESVMSNVTALVTEDTLDESPMAYKNIFDVMKLQSDLVEIKYHITPIINIKG